jgi:two-component system nitrate/nitrite response regulator NarL
MPTSVMTLLLDLAPVTTELKSQDKAEAGLEWSDPRLRKLSTRESQILHCLTDGAPNKVIARKLDVAEATVKVMLKPFYARLGPLIAPRLPCGRRLICRPTLSLPSEPN